MKKALQVTLAVLLIVGLVLVPMYCTLVPSGRAFINNWTHSLHKVDDSTKYSTKKKVEDTCRSMIASYGSDKLTYEQYKDSENEEKQSWAEQAKMRANKTAVTYNEYILKNSYVWEDNIPEDINIQLEVIQ